MEDNNDNNAANEENRDENQEEMVGVKVTIQSSENYHIQLNHY